MEEIPQMKKLCSISAILLFATANTVFSQKTEPKPTPTVCSTYWGVIVDGETSSTKGSTVDIGTIYKRRAEAMANPDMLKVMADTEVFDELVEAVKRKDYDKIDKLLIKMNQQQLSLDPTEGYVNIRGAIEYLSPLKFAVINDDPIAIEKLIKSGANPCAPALRLEGSSETMSILSFATSFVYPKAKECFEKNKIVCQQDEASTVRQADNWRNPSQEVERLSEWE
jgi:hypothetical protein